MTQRLFDVNKIPVFLDSYAPGIEKRRGEEVSIYTLTLRVQPFDAQLAAALDAGLGDSSNIKATLFSLSTSEPKANFTRHDFKLGLERQRLLVYASRDTAEARIVFDQAKIFGTYVRTQKDIPNQLALVFKASFGPLGREELEYIYAWFRGQRAVTFEEAEDSIAFAGIGDAPDEDDDAEPVVAAETPGHRTPMFDTDPEGRPVAAGAVVTAGKPKRRRAHAAQ